MITPISARPQATAAAAAAPTTPRPPKITPLLLQGLTEEQKRSYLQLHSPLHVDKSLIARTKMTKAGNVIIAPVNMEASKTLLEAKLPENLTIKTVESNRKHFASPYLVLHGVPTAVDADAIKEATGFPSRRLLSAANKGQPTSKVRITISSEDDKKDILQNVLLLGHQRVKAVAYENMITLMLQVQWGGSHRQNL